MYSIRLAISKMSVHCATLISQIYYVQWWFKHQTPNVSCLLWYPRHWHIKRHSMILFNKNIHGMLTRKASSITHFVQTQHTNMNIYPYTACIWVYEYSGRHTYEWTRVSTYISTINCLQSYFRLLCGHTGNGNTIQTNRCYTNYTIVDI